MKLYTIVGRDAGVFFSPSYMGHPIQPKTDYQTIVEDAIRLKKKYPMNEYFIMGVKSKVVPQPPIEPAYTVVNVD